LSEDVKDADLRELFRRFGPIQRIYLAKDRETHQSRGFAFINFFNRDEAAKAIQTLNGHGYDHLILSVTWANPSGGGGGDGASASVAAPGPGDRLARGDENRFEKHIYNPSIDRFRT